MRDVILKNVRLAEVDDWTDGQHRVGTVEVGHEAFRAILGDPLDEDWTPGDDGGLDGSGKVHISWVIDTPRGQVQVYDYWWNPAGILSLGASGKWPALWAVKWLRLQGVPCRLGM